MSETDQSFHFSLDASLMEMEERLAFARSFLGAGYEVGPLDDGRFDGRADFWMLDGLTAADIKGVHCRLVRLGKPDPDNTIRVTLVRGGRSVGTIGGQAVDQSAGQLTLDGSAATVAVESENLSNYIVGMMGDLVGYDAGLHPSFIQFWPGDPESAILASAMVSFFDCLRGADRQTCERMAKVMIGLVRGVVSNIPVPGEEVGDRRRDRLQAMRRHIEENLASQTLGADELQRRFNTSRAVVYRLFTPFGGVSKYLAERRLTRAMSLLTSSSFANASIGRIAQEVGYRDQRHFARAFRQRYGITPSEARSAFTGGKLSPSTEKSPAASIGRRFTNFVVGQG